MLIMSAYLSCNTLYGYVIDFVFVRTSTGTLYLLVCLMSMTFDAGPAGRLLWPESFIIPEASSPELRLFLVVTQQLRSTGPCPLRDVAQQAQQRPSEGCRQVRIRIPQVNGAERALWGLTGTGGVWPSLQPRHREQSRSEILSVFPRAWALQGLGTRQGQSGVRDGAGAAMGFFSLPMIMASSVLVVTALAYAAYTGVVTETYAAVLTLVLALTIRFAAENQPGGAAAEGGDDEAEDEPAAKGKDSKKGRKKK